MEMTGKLLRVSESISLTGLSKPTPQFGVQCPIPIIIGRFFTCRLATNKLSAIYPNERVRVYRK